MSDANNVMTSQNGRDAIGLDWSWDSVLAMLHVLENDRMQSSLLEL